MLLLREPRACRGLGGLWFASGKDMRFSIVDMLDLKHFGPSKLPPWLIALLSCRAVEGESGVPVVRKDEEFALK